MQYPHFNLCDAFIAQVHIAMIRPKPHALLLLAQHFCEPRAPDISKILVKMFIFVKENINFLISFLPSLHPWCQDGSFCYPIQTHDSWLICDSPQSVPSPLPLDSGEVSISSELDRKSNPFSASSASGSSLVSILAGNNDDDDDDDDDGFFLRIWVKKKILFINRNRWRSDLPSFRKHLISIIEKMQSSHVFAPLILRRTLKGTFWDRRSVVVKWETGLMAFLKYLHWAILKDSYNIEKHFTTPA